MESELLLARVEDTLNASVLNNRPKFLGFLSKEESVLVENFLKKRNAKFTFFGGEHFAQRVFLCCYPEWMDKPSFPIKALTFTYRAVDNLRHRDFLGALMSLGLKRETIGDILIEKGRGVVFLSEEIEDFVLRNLSKIGRVGVCVTKGYTLPLPESDTLTEKNAIISSLRLDCVVSALANLSRNSANEYIENGLVSINSVVYQKSTKLVNDGDVITIRHKGKFQIIATDKKTKKEKTVLKFNSF